MNDMEQSVNAGKNDARRQRVDLAREAFKELN
jgi:hypothetical protein